MGGGGRDARATVPSAGTVLGLGLDTRVEEFTRLLLEAPQDDIRAERREWLRMRYEEIVPLVLPAALRSVELGVPLDPGALESLRRVAAQRASDPHSDVSVVLRGAMPALRVFGLVVQTASREHAHRTVLAMSRASFVAHELGTCWAEAWWARREEATAAGDGDVYATADEVEIVPHGSELAANDERILALAARGVSTEGISRATSYSKQAVAWHLGRLMKAWRAPNRTALVSFAFARGWLRHRPARRLRALPPPSGAEPPATGAEPLAPGADGDRAPGR